VFWQSDIALISSYGSAPRDLEAALEAIAAGRLDVESLITHRLPLGQVQAGFRLMLEGGAALKVILDPRLDQ
jgi:L-iditol 2-dehydrogenase